MQQADLRKLHKSLYSPKFQPQIVDVPSFPFIMVDGKGDPNNSKEFSEAIESIYGVAYTLKFLHKKFPEYDFDFTMMPLEGLWWTPDMREFNMQDKSNWLWTLMIMMPEFITPAIFEKAKTLAFEKKGNARIKELRLEDFKEGRAAQVLYIGAYKDEGPTILDLHKFIHEQGGKFEGVKEKHHEIYMSDARKTAPDKLKTIIRQPFRLG
jgi:hypothetical protein